MAANGIGEADGELEQMLFGERMNRAGDSLQALELEVTVEGPDKVNPITQVRSPPADPTSFITNTVH